MLVILSDVKETFDLNEILLSPSMFNFVQVIEVKCWTIYVKYQSGETIPVDLDNLTQVKYIRGYIKSQDGIAANRQVLKVKFKPLITIFRQQIYEIGILVSNIGGGGLTGVI